MLSSCRLLACLLLLTLLPLTRADESTGGVSEQTFQRLWTDLAAADAARAYRALWALARSPDEAVAFVCKHLSAAAEPDARKVDAWIKDLSSERFAVREKANLELAKLGGLAEAALKKAMQGGQSLEARQRMEKLLNKLLAPLTLAEHLRAVRAVELLEQIGSDAARNLLKSYSAGAPAARLTQDATLALERLGKGRGDLASALPEQKSRTDLYGDPLPAGAVARLGTIRFRHEGGDIAFLPGDRTLLTVARQLSGSRGLQIWNADDGRLEREISTEPLSIQASALSPDGKRFALAGFYPWRVQNEPPPAEVRVLDLASGKVLYVLPRKNSRDVFNCKLALSPDGKLLFSVGNAGVVRVEDLATGKELAQRKFVGNFSGGLAISPDGNHLAIASGPNSRKPYLWKWRDQQPRSLKGFEDGISGACFSPDGTLLAAIGGHEAAVRVWDVPDGRLLYQREFPDRDYYFSGNLAFTPDGRRLIASLRHRRGSHHDKIELLDSASGRSQGILPGSFSFSVSSDSRRLAFSSGCGVRIFDLNTRKELSANDEAHDGSLTQIVVSPHGFLATASNDNTVRLWGAKTSKQRRKFAVNAWVRAIAVAPDAGLLAASSFDDAVHVWDIATGRERYRLAGHGELGGRRTLGFSPDSRSLFSWGDDFYLRLWDMKTGKARFEHAIRPEGVKVPTEDDSGLGRKEEFMLSLGSAALTPNGKTFVLDIAGKFHLFDTASGKERAKFPSEAGYQTLMTISPDGRYLLTSASGSYQIKTHPIALWDLSSGKGLWRMPVAGSQPGPVAFSADGRMFATSVGETENQVLVYEMASGEVRHTIRGFRGRVRSLAFFPDNRRLATGLSDSTVLIWDLTAPVAAHKGP